MPFPFWLFIALEILTECITLLITLTLDFSLVEKRKSGQRQRDFPRRDQLCESKIFGSLSNGVVLIKSALCQ